MTIKFKHLTVKKSTTTILDEINLVINENWAIISEVPIFVVGRD